MNFSKGNMHMNITFEVTTKEAIHDTMYQKRTNHLMRHIQATPWYNIRRKSYMIYAFLPTQTIWCFINTTNWKRFLLTHPRMTEQLSDPMWRMSFIYTKREVLIFEQYFMNTSDLYHAYEWINKALKCCSKSADTLKVFSWSNPELWIDKKWHFHSYEPSVRNTHPSGHFGSTQANSSSYK